MKGSLIFKLFIELLDSQFESSTLYQVGSKSLYKFKKSFIRFIRFGSITLQLICRMLNSYTDKIAL